MLNIYLEELKGKYKQFKFEPLDNSELGVQAKVEIGKFNKDGLKKTKFLKKDYYNQTEAFREIIAYYLIEYVNKAYRASGFRIDSMPIPKQFDWDVVNDRIEFLTSGVSSKKDLTDDDDIINDLIEGKFVYMNALLGNNDAHAGNIVYKSMGKLYAIDFGYALYNNEDYEIVIDELLSRIEDIYEKGNPKEIKQIIKILFFWSNFLKLNKSNIIRIVKSKSNEIIKKIENPVVKNKHIELRDKIVKLLNIYIPKLKTIYIDSHKEFEKLHRKFESDGL